MDPILTAVGQIIDGDNRFLGRSVFDGWVHDLQTPNDLLLASFGLQPVTDAHRDAARLISLALTSPDARVWPLKLTRLLSSWGDPLAGYFGAQLLTAGRVMGPGAATLAGKLLHGVGERVGPHPSVEEVSAAIAAWRTSNPGPLGGFGVPFRPVDERRAALIRFVGDGPLSQGRFWQLHLVIAEALPKVAPNVALAIAALLLDLGLPPGRCGLAVAVLMSHVFLAHAIEGAQRDAAVHDWPVSRVSYQGAPARATGDGQRAAVPPALQRSTA